MEEKAKCAICIAEDRRSEQDAVKLLLLSLSRHCPDLDVFLTYPAADESFRAWAARLSRVVLRVDHLRGASGWNVKPHALLPLLAEGYEEVWWIDSDVILARDFRAVVPQVTEETFVVCQEALYGAGGHLDRGARAAAWGFDAGRALPSTLNSCVIRVTRAHIPLLERWKELLGSDEYVRAQRRPWFERPNHMVGDQDVLTALLSSREFASIPVVILRRGREIIQYFGPPGYTTSERLINLAVGLPPFVHEQGGGKPWHLAQARRARGLRPAVDRLYSELSPYRHCAGHYRDEIREDSDDTAWLDYTSRAGRALWAMGLGRAPLIGLPLALAYSAWRPVRVAAQSLRRRFIGSGAETR